MPRAVAVRALPPSAREINITPDGDPVVRIAFLDVCTPSTMEYMREAMKSYYRRNPHAVQLHMNVVDGRNITLRKKIDGRELSMSDVLSLLQGLDIQETKATEKPAKSQKKAPTGTTKKRSGNHRPITGIFRAAE